MLHKNRTWGVTDIESMDELATNIVEYSWTTCTGFRCGSLLVLNDSTGPDGAQEYAVMKDGRQVESLTCSWGATPDEIADTLRILNDSAEDYWGGDYGSSWTPEVAVNTNHESGYCQDCA